MNVSILESLTDSSCVELAWISNQTICSTLTARLNAAAAAIAVSDFPVARASLDGFVTELDARYDTTQALVTDNAYWMLSTNAKHIRFEILPPTACGEVTPIPLYGLITQNVGQMQVWNNAQNLYVRYTLTNEWQASKTHVAVATSVAGIPTNAQGDPVVNDFPYKQTHAPAVTDYTYTVPLSAVGGTPNAPLVIAARGNIFRGSVSGLSWPEGTRFNTQGEHWAMYFTYQVVSCQ